MIIRVGPGRRSDLISNDSEIQSSPRPQFSSPWPRAGRGSQAALAQHRDSESRAGPLLVPRKRRPRPGARRAQSVERSCVLSGKGKYESTMTV